MAQAGTRRGWFTGWALAAGVLAASATVLLGWWITRDDTYDGSVKLDTPGVFQDPTDSNPADVTGNTLPDAALVDADGAARSFHELAGSPAVINMWFVACAPCARELGEFATVDAELRAAGSPVRIVGIDPFDDTDSMIAFAAERGVGYDLWRDTGRTLGVDLGITAYPVTLYLDAAGNVVRRTGATTADELRNNIAELFG